MFGIRKTHMKTVELPKPKQKAIPYSIDDELKGYLKFGNAQSIGNRKEQQDSFGYSNISESEIISSKGIMAVIADGMGGLSHGKQVSEVVVKEMISRFSDIIQNEPIASQLEDIVDAINNEVCENLLEKNSISAGTTLASICIFKQFAFWLSVGDSRIYLKRHNALYQLNEDNDYYNQLLSEYIFGIGTIEAAKNDKQKDSLTSYIGNPKLPYVDYNKRALEILENDEFLLCSDGVYNALSNDELLECMKDEPQHASEKIIKKVTSKKSPGQDNSTVMLIKINFKESE